MSVKKPTPLIPPLRGAICPVCKTRTYSQGGIHPQCAVHQADAARAEELRAERKRAGKSAKPPAWEQEEVP